MAKGSYTVTHKGSDGDEIQSFTERDSEVASDRVSDVIEELEGDSGASITVTWEV